MPHAKKPEGEISREGRRKNAKQARGICRQCEEPAAPGNTLCEAHRVQQATRRQSVRKSEVAAGRCSRACGRIIWAGSPDKCKECYEKMRKQFAAWYDANRRKKPKKPKPG